jgi:HK97 family phage prohead protease
MAESTDRGSKRATKALPGSFEARAAAIAEALKTANILPAGDVWVSDTFDDYVVACVWVYGAADEGGYKTWETTYYKVAITAEGEAGFEFGEVTKVEKVYTEELVAAAKGLKDKAHTKARSPFRLKSLEAVDDEVGGWKGSGCFSVFDYEDHSKDIVRRGSTKRSIAQHLPKILDHHGTTVGQSTKAWEDDEGLQVDFRIYPTSAGEDLVKLMRPIETDLGLHAPVEQGSIGFSPLEGGAKRRKSGGWEYTDLWIWEVSPVTFGDNDATSVGLKSMTAVNTMPTADLVAYAGEVVRLAVDGADGVKALHRRRLEEDRGLSDAQWKSVDALIIDSAEAALALLELKGRAAKATSNAHLRHMRGIVDSLAALIHGREDAPATEKDDPDKDQEGAAKASAGAEEAQLKGFPSKDDDFELELMLADLGLDS